MTSQAWKHEIFQSEGNFGRVCLSLLLGDSKGSFGCIKLKLFVDLAHQIL